MNNSKKTPSFFDLLDMGFRKLGNIGSKDTENTLFNRLEKVFFAPLEWAEKHKSPSRFIVAMLVTLAMALITFFAAMLTLLFFGFLATIGIHLLFANLGHVILWTAIIVLVYELIIRPNLKTL